MYSRIYFFLTIQYINKNLEGTKVIKRYFATYMYLFSQVNKKHIIFNKIYI